jgi:hypothetical protein
MRQSISTLLDLFTRSDFRWGVLIGILGLGALALIHETRPSPRAWGSIFALAAVISIIVGVEATVPPVPGLLALTFGGVLIDQGDRQPMLRWIGWVVVLAGAGLVGWSGSLADPGWLAPLSALAIVLGGAVVSIWPGQSPDRALGPMLAITAFGIWVTVPETELARALLGVAVALMFGTLAPIRARLARADAFALVGTLVWVVAAGGHDRPASVIGGWACLGLVAILPMVEISGRHDRRLPFPYVLWIHAGFVLIASRVIGLWESALIATVAVVVVTVCAMVLLGSIPESRLHADEATDHGPE